MLNEEFLGKAGPTDVLAFPIDGELVEVEDGPGPHRRGPDRPPPDPGDLPAPARRRGGLPDRGRRARRPSHAGTVDDELALLVVHGVLHVLGHDHAEADETARMRSREMELLQELHWNGPRAGRLPPGARRVIAVELHHHRPLDAGRHRRAAGRPRLPRHGGDGAQPDQPGQGPGHGRLLRHPRGPRSLAKLANQPERFINSLLVTITICQTGQAFLTSILADRLFGTVGVHRGLRPERGGVLRAGRGRAQDLRHPPPRAGGPPQHAGHLRAGRASRRCSWCRGASSA